MKKEGGNKGSNKTTFPRQEIKKDRKSATGMIGSPKKGGHGGKFMWYGDGYSRSELGFVKDPVDAKDLNFEDGEEVAVAGA